MSLVILVIRSLSDWNIINRISKSMYLAKIWCRHPVMRTCLYTCAYLPAHTCGSSDSTVRIYNTGYTNEALVAVAERVTKRGQNGWRAWGGPGEGIAATTWREEPEGSSSKRGKRERENRNGRKRDGAKAWRGEGAREEEDGREGGARAVDVGTSVSRCEGRNRSLPGSQGGWAEWNEWVESRNRMESKGAPVTRSSYVPLPSPPPLFLVLADALRQQIAFYILRVYVHALSPDVYTPRYWYLKYERKYGNFKNARLHFWYRLEYFRCFLEIITINLLLVAIKIQFFLSPKSLWWRIKNLELFPKFIESLKNISLFIFLYLCNIMLIV